MSDIIKGFFIKPARANVMVRDPVTRKPLADAGEWKPRNSYWLRRERDKDVVQTNAPKVDKPAKPKPQLKAVISNSKPEGDK